MKQTVNTKQEYLRNVLETMKQQMLSSSSKTRLQLESCPRLESDFPFITSSMPPMPTPPPPTPLTEVIIGVGYVLLILVFLSKVFFKTLNRFTSDYSSSHDGVYNRFAFITNADSDSEFSTDDDDDDDTLSDSLSPVQPSIYTPRPPTSPHPPLRRSKRLQMKSEINLTKLEKQTQTQHQKRNSKKTFPEVSSDPLPFTKRRTLSFMSPSPHPHHDEELEFEIQRRYEKRSQKRSECNSPLVVRRLIL